MKKICFISIFIISLSFSFAFAAEFNHTEIRNDFNNTDWFAASDRVILNETLTSYQLNSSLVLPDDFSTFSEIDTRNIITTNSTTITYINDNLGEIRNNIAERVWIDRTIKKNQKFSYNFDFDLEAIDSNSYTIGGGIFGLTNETDSIRDIGIVNIKNGFFVRYMSYNTGSKFYLSIVHYNNGASVENFTAQNIFDVQRWYYLNVQKTSTKYILNVFNDSSRTQLISELSLLLSATDSFTYNKQYSLINGGYSSGTKNSYGYVKNLISALNYGFEEKGFLYFKNVLENTTKKASWFITNQTISDGILQVSFSDDNSTWLRNTTLNDGLAAIYLYDLNISDVFIKYRFDRGISESPTLNDASIFYLTSENELVVDGLVFGDINWMVLFIWIAVICLAYVTEKIELKTVGSIIGMILGLMILSSSILIGFLVFILNLIILLWELSK